MYAVEILKGTEWVHFIKSEDIRIIDKVVYKLTKLRPNKYMRVLKYNYIKEAYSVLEVLNGTEYQYWYFKNKYVRNKGINFDYIGFYQKKLERQTKN